MQLSISCNIQIWYLITTLSLHRHRVETNLEKINGVSESHYIDVKSLPRVCFLLKVML